MHGSFLILISYRWRLSALSFSAINIGTSLRKVSLWSESLTGSISFTWYFVYNFCWRIELPLFYMLVSSLRFRLYYSVKRMKGLWRVRWKLIESTMPSFSLYHLAILSYLWRCWTPLLFDSTRSVMTFPACLESICVLALKGSVFRGGELISSVSLPRLRA